jgi:hypothetical protein
MTNVQIAMARGEAMKQSSALGATLDCFASLAKTARRQAAR